MRTPGSEQRGVGGLAAALVALLPACAPLASHQTAEPAPAGRWQIAGAVGGAVYVDTEQRSKTPAPAVDFVVRRGLGANVDVGARLFLLGMGLGAKWKFVSGSWPVAIAPEVLASRYGDTALVPPSFFGWGSLPIVIGHRFGERFGVNFGPKALYGFYQPKTGGTAHGLSLGGFVDVEIRIAKGARLLPELVVLQAALGDVPVRGPSVYFGPGVLVDF